MQQPAYDDFHNAWSGWPILLGPDLVAQYDLPSRYQIHSQPNTQTSVIKSPFSVTAQYTLEVDTWIYDGISYQGSSHGIAFSISNDFSSYYLFLINTQTRSYGLFQVNNSQVTTIVNWKTTNALQSPIYNVTNHLKVVHTPGSFTLYINGTNFGPYSDTLPASSSGCGLAVGPYNSSLGAYFDNFSIK